MVLCGRALVGERAWRPRKLAGPRARTRITCAADQAPPLGVGTPRSFRPAATARSEVAPFACSSAMIGAISAALASALRPRCRQARQCGYEAATCTT
jgi:hypothetical protein